MNETFTLRNTVRCLINEGVKINRGSEIFVKFNKWEVKINGGSEFQKIR